MKNTLSYDILKPEQARMLALLLSTLQGQCVNFGVSQDYNLVFVEIK